MRTGRGQRPVRIHAARSYRLLQALISATGSVQRFFTACVRRRNTPLLRSS